MKKPLSGFSFYISCPDKEKHVKWTNKVLDYGGKVQKKKSVKAAAFVLSEGTKKQSNYITVH